MHILFTKRVYERFQQLQPATHLNGEIENAKIDLKVGGADIVVGAEVLRWLSEPIKLDEFRPSKFLGKSSAHEICPYDYTTQVSENIAYPSPLPTQSAPVYVSPCASTPEDETD